MSRYYRHPCKELRPLLQQAEREGWTIAPTGGSHWLLRAPTGARVVVSSSPHGGRRSIENTRADLRRAGLRVAR